MAYINREHLIQVLAHENLNTEVGRQYYGAVYQKVMSFPTADVAEVKHGYWQIEDRGGEPTRRPICSRCGATPKYYVRGKATPYCHECGAKMDGSPREKE